MRAIGNCLFFIGFIIILGAIGAIAEAEAHLLKLSFVAIIGLALIIISAIILNEIKDY